MTTVREIWFNARLYRVTDEGVEVQAQRSATQYWRRIEEGPLTARIKAYAERARTQ